MGWIIPPVAGFLDTGTAPEFYVDGIGGIENGSGNIRVYLIAHQAPVDPSHPATNLVTAKIVGPVLNVPQIIGQLAQCLWRPETVHPRGKPHLVL